MSATKDCSIVVPVFNAESSLPLLVERTIGALVGVSERFEIILVNDDSRDHSWTVICGLAEKYPEVVGINLMRNYGQHGALLAGIRQARFSITVTLDDDLQTPPEEIPRLLQKLDEGFELVYGTPIQESHGLTRFVASRLTKFCLRMAFGATTAQMISPFRVFRTRLRDGFSEYRSNSFIIDPLLTWSTSKVGSVRVEHAPRAFGSSNYNLYTLLRHAINMMTCFSTAPLQLASWLGFALTGFGGCVLVYVLGRYLIHQGSVPGFPFLASIIALFSGAQLFTIGIIGEYMARMYNRMMERPPYVIREILDDSARRAA